MYIALIENDHANMAIEEDDFSKALKVAEQMATTNDYGKVYSAGVYETDKVVMGSENIKNECRLVASLRVIR